MACVTNDGTIRRTTQIPTAGDRFFTSTTSHITQGRRRTRELQEARMCTERQRARSSHNTRRIAMPRLCGFRLSVHACTLGLQRRSMIRHSTAAGMGHSLSVVVRTMLMPPAATISWPRKFVTSYVVRSIIILMDRNGLHDPPRRRRRRLRGWVQRRRRWRRGCYRMPTRRSDVDHKLACEAAVGALRVFDGLPRAAGLPSHHLIGHQMEQDAGGRARED